MLNRTTLSVLVPQIEQELKAFCDKHNLSVKFQKGNLSHDASNASLTFRFDVNSNDGKSVEQKEFEKYASLFDLKASDYKRKFMSNGKQYTLTGIAPSRPKFPLLGIDERGRTFKFTRSVLEKLKAQEK